MIQRCLHLLLAPDKIVQVRELVRRIEAWLAARKLAPDMLDIKQESLYSGKPATYSRTRDRLYDEAVEKAYTVQIFLRRPETKSVLNLLFSVFCSMRGGREVFAMFSESIAQITRNDWVEFARSIHEPFPFSYGYSYVLDELSGPLYYARGTLYGAFDHPVKDPDESLRTAWAHALSRRRQSNASILIRQVYSLQFLSDDYLRATVEGVTLKEWIESSPKHGSLSPLVPGIWIWDIEDPADRLHANQTLSDAGLLAAWGPLSLL